MARQGLLNWITTIEPTSVGHGFGTPITLRAMTVEQPKRIAQAPTVPTKRRLMDEMLDPFSRGQPLREDDSTGPRVRIGDRKPYGIRGYALPVSPSVSYRLHRIRVTVPIGDPRSIRVAERERMAQVGGESLILGLNRHW
jgi:hypothetical protein